VDHVRRGLVGHDSLVMAASRAPALSACQAVYVELYRRIGKVADRLFEGEEAVFHLIERIVAPLGLRVDGSSPWVDARLPDGSRVQTRFLCAPFFERTAYSRTR
jgi:Flp pilus assembly CpaF family ATPase